MELRAYSARIFGPVRPDDTYPLAGTCRFSKPNPRERRREGQPGTARGVAEEFEMSALSWTGVDEVWPDSALTRLSRVGAAAGTATSKLAAADFVSDEQPENG